MDIDVNQITLEHINRQLVRLENTANNVSNINTSGYISKDNFSTVVNGQLVEQQSFSISNQGISQTTRSLDFAINGDGFFTLALNGETLLTRNGRFHVNSDGLLAHSSGGVVIGKQGPIALSVQNETMTVNTQGEILVGNEKVGQLNIVKPQKLKSLNSKSHLLYSINNNELLTVEQSITQGALNSSSVNSSNEMIKMMELSRTLQTGQKVIQAYDQLLNVGINELGKK